MGMDKWFFKIHLTGTPQWHAKERRKMKRTLEELKTKAWLALMDDDLIDIAEENSSPTAVYEVLTHVFKKPWGRARPWQSFYFTEEEAKSCRFLAIIKRDFGEAVFKKLLWQTEKPRYEHELKMTLDRIKLFETAAGFPLCINEPKELDNVPFTDFLQNWQLEDVWLEMKFKNSSATAEVDKKDDWRICFRMAADKSKHSITWRSDFDFVRTSPALHSSADTFIHSYNREGRKKHHLYLKRFFLRFIRELAFGNVAYDFISSFEPCGSAFFALFWSLWNSMEDEGKKLWISQSLKELATEGTLDDLEEAIAKARQEVLSTGIEPRHLAFIDVQEIYLRRLCQRVR